MVLEQEITETLKEGEKKVDFEVVQSGRMSNGLIGIEKVYNNPPKRYEVVQCYDALGFDILKDLDYVAVTDEVTTN